MSDSSSLNAELQAQTYKDGLEFDLFWRAFRYLSGKSEDGFLCYSDARKHLGRKFNISRQESRRFLNILSQRGYISLKKRGILLLEEPA